MKHVNDPELRVYGRMIIGYEVSRPTGEMKKIPLSEDIVCAAPVPELETLLEVGALADDVYDGIPIQIGYCNGHNRKLNALEYHQDSEVGLAVMDTILLIGRQQDITGEYTCDTELVEALFVLAGTLIEVYATTLHYAPHQMDEGEFCRAVVFPRETNEELAGPAAVQCGKDRLLFARNKRLVDHGEAGLLENAWIGLKGENASI